VPASPEAATGPASGGVTSDEPDRTDAAGVEGPGSGGSDVDPTSTASGPGAALTTVLGALAGLWGLMIGLGRLGDNSFFTHLQTGRLILEDGRVPTTDPYSFTAHGEPWVVQSWLASVLYAGLDEIGEFAAIRLAIGLTTAGLALLVWRLCRPAESVLGRVGVTSLALAVGTGLWVERPLIFGLLFLAVVLVAAEGGLDPRWLVPVMWLWVNMHGSFPLAGIALVVLALGRRLDGGRPAVELRALAWCVGGIVLAAVNPLGPRLVAFPLRLITQTASFEGIVEWQPPNFDTVSQKLFLLQLFVAVVLLVRKPSYRVALPLAAFGLMALLSARNVVPASVVLVPGMALAVGRAGALDGRLRTRFFTVATGAIAFLALPLTALGLSGPADVKGYPTEALDWLDGRDQIRPGSHLITQDFVANYLEVRYGPDEVQVFIDDRVDMFPLSVSQDYRTLLNGGSRWRTVLDRYDTDVVVWAADKPLTPLMVASPDWRLVYRDDDWVIGVPQGSPLRADR
jgi:hypothetical protein